MMYKQELHKNILPKDKIGNWGWYNTWEKEKGRLVAHYQTPNPSEAQSYTNAHRPGSSASEDRGYEEPPYIFACQKGQMVPIG